VFRRPSHGCCPPPCEEEVNFVGNQQRPNQQQGHQVGSSSQGQYSGNSNQGRYLGNNNNFPRGNQYGQPWRPPPNYYYQQPYNNYYQYPPQNNPQQQQHRPQSTDETLNQFMQMSMVNQKNIDASIKGLETQMGQMAQQIAQATQQGGAFTANTQDNPKGKEHCKAISTRSGKVIGKGIGDDIEVEWKVVEKFDFEEDDVKVGSEREVEEDKGELVENEKREVVEKDEMERKKKDVVREKGKKKEVEKKVSTQHLPYPHAPSKKDKERQYARFLELFKKLQIDIPFSEALEQMSAYAKFMKDILSKKKRINDEETIQLDANCSVIIQQRFPKKEQDPGNHFEYLSFMLSDRLIDGEIVD